MLFQVFRFEKNASRRDRSMLTKSNDLITIQERYVSIFRTEQRLNRFTITIEFDDTCLSMQKKKEINSPSFEVIYISRK